MSLLSLLVAAVVAAVALLTAALVVRKRRAAGAARARRQLANQHVLVTGGSSGIGLAVARLAASCGACVTIVARHAERLAAARAEVLAVSTCAAVPATADGGAGAGDCDDLRCLALSCDLASTTTTTADSPADDPTAAAGATEEQQERREGEEEKSVTPAAEAVRRAESLLGPVDVLVCCAGFALAQRMDDMPLATHRRLMQVNYFGVLHTLHAVVPGMRRRRRGRICVVSSLAGLMGIWGFAGYCAAKYALVGLAHALAQELRALGVSVTVCYPPDTDTPGLAAENVTKPPETRMVSAVASLASARHVAAQLLDDTLAGRPDSLHGPEGFLLGSLALGTQSPVGRRAELLLQLVTLPLMRLLMVATHRQWDRQLQQLDTQKELDKKVE